MITMELIGILLLALCLFFFLITVLSKPWQLACGGILIGIFLSLSAFEWLHEKIEIRYETYDVCGVILKTVEGETNLSTAHALRIIFKAFAWPMKTVMKEVNINFPDTTHNNIILNTYDYFQWDDEEDTSIRLKEWEHYIVPMPYTFNRIKEDD